MKTMTTTRLLATAAAVALMLSGCAELNPPTLHLLPGLVAHEGAGGGAVSREQIALSRIALPDYAEDNAIAFLTGATTVARSMDERWADPLARAATAALANALSGRTGALVLAEPWPPEFDPTLRIDVLVDQFVGALGGLVTLSGEVRVADARQRGLAVVRRFDITAPATGAGFDGVVRGHAEAVGLLADEIAAALEARYGE